MKLINLMATPKYKAVGHFHVHAYFPLTPQGIEAGKNFRDAFAATFNGDEVHTHPIVPKQVGPHPQGHGMWQSNITRSAYTEVVTWLQYNRPLEVPSVMIHPDTPEHVLDHMERSVWFGQRLPLDPTMLYLAEGRQPPAKEGA